MSHSLGQIEEICDRSIWIDAGRIRMDGQPKEVHEKYLEYMGVKTGRTEAGEDTRRTGKGKRKTGKAGTAGTAACSKHFPPAGYLLHG